MDCPKCPLGKLGEVTVHALMGAPGQTVDLTVDQCFTCQGVWFDAGELDQYLKLKLTVVSSDFLPDTSVKAIDQQIGKCPKCHVEMEQRKEPKRKNIVVDFCKTCGGLWLDIGELDRIESKGLKIGEKFDSILEYFRTLGGAR